MPYKCDDQRVDKWSKDTLDELIELSISEKNNNSGEGDNLRPLVEIVPTLYLTNSHKGPTVDDFKNFESKDYFEGGNNKSPLPNWTKDPRLAFQHLTIDMLGWQNQVLKLKIPSIDVMKEAGYTHGWLFRPPIVDPPRMLMVSPKVLYLISSLSPYLALHILTYINLIFKRTLEYAE